MKRSNDLFPLVVDWSNVVMAMHQASHGHRKYKPDIAFFLQNYAIELLSLQQELVCQTYIPSPYHQFTIYDPKKRLINVANFRDRVVHHALCNVIGHILDNTLIPTSFACRKDKGMHKALFLVKEWVKKYSYFLKLDIAKYFDSISHSRLADAITLKIKDARVLSLVTTIIRNVPSNFSCGYGLPIGNLTSQYFANYYLSSLDHYIKQQLKIPAYARYMDDMVLLSNTKEQLSDALQKIQIFLKNFLDLQLKAKATILGPVVALAPNVQGLPFLGFRIFKNATCIHKKNWRRFKNKLYKCQELFTKGEITVRSLQEKVTSITNHICYGDTAMIRKKFLEKYDLDV